MLEDDPMTSRIEPTPLTGRFVPVSQPRQIDHAAQAGFLAAVIMVAAQLLWRLNWSSNGAVQAFPEFIVAAASRLTPLSVFGAATENYGSLAKKALLVTVVLAIAAVGMWGGKVAGVLAQRIGTSFLGRFVSGSIVAAGLLLVTLVVIMPIANLGVFARESSYTNDILTQLVVTFGIYALVWAVFTDELFESEPDYTSEHTSRRAFLLDAVTLAGVVVAAGSIWRLVNPRVPKVSSTVSNQTVNDIVATQRAAQGHPLNTPVPTVAAQDTAMLTSDLVVQDEVDPIALFQQLDTEGIVTPVLTATPDFYHVSKNIIDPTVSADGWSLTIKGLVDKEMTYTHDQLMERATTQRITTLCCISNQLNGDLISTAQWTAVPLIDLLNEAGIKDGAVDLKFHAADDYEDSVSIEVGTSENNMVVVGMNGEPLTDDHGFPARLIIPNIYGMKNVKWIDTIEVVDNDFKGYWEEQGWSDTAVVNIWGRIDNPENREDLPTGKQTLTGVAAAGARDVSRVEVTLDDAKSWTDAILEPSLNPPFTWVRWALPVDLKEGDYKMRIRVTDGDGNVMDVTDRSPLPDGATGWPRRTVHVKG
jgi:DMSO/TMAO reductase YedYZ molybdopterin-dependent catalytic subunit